MLEHKAFIDSEISDPRCEGEDSAAMYALSIWHYLRNKDKIQLVLFYEDLVKNPQKTILDIFRLFNISKEYLESCLRILDVDSQDGIFLRASQSNENVNSNFKHVIEKVFGLYGIDLRAEASLDELKEYLK